MLTAPITSLTPPVLKCKIVPATGPVSPRERDQIHRCSLSSLATNPSFSGKKADITMSGSAMSGSMCGLRCMIQTEIQ